jgi:cytidylate kinase
MAQKKNHLLFEEGHLAGWLLVRKRVDFSIWDEAMSP